MRVPHVSTGTGQSVTLRFAEDQVHVHEVSAARQVAARTGVGGLLVGTGMAAVAVNAGGRGFAGLDVALWVLVAAAVVAAAGGAAWWSFLTRRDRRGAAQTIPAAAVVSARSKADAGQVTVDLQLQDGEERSFTAVGQSGAQLSAGFGRLLTVSEPIEHPAP